MTQILARQDTLARQHVLHVCHDVRRDSFIGKKERGEIKCVCVIYLRDMTD